MKKVLCVLLVLSLLIIPVAGCKSQTLQKVRLHEVTHSVFYAAQYIAIEKGYFEEEGLDIELTNAGGADKAMTALLAGQADIALMGPESSIYVYNEGREDYTQVIGQLTARDGCFIIGREENADFTLEDLRGKSILGGRAGGMPLMTLEYALRQAGLEPGVDVEVRTDVQFNLMAGAFAGGEADYTTLFEPTATDFELQGKGFVMAAVGDHAGALPYTCYQITKSGLEKDPEMVDKFMRALYRAQKFVAENDAKAVAEALAPAFTDSSIDTLTKVVERYREIGAFATTPVMTQESYERLMDIMQQAGELDTRAPYDKVINNTVAEKVIAE